MKRVTVSFSWTDPSMRRSRQRDDEAGILPLMSQGVNPSASTTKKSKQGSKVVAMSKDDEGRVDLNSFDDIDVGSGDGRYLGLSL